MTITTFCASIVCGCVLVFGIAFFIDRMVQWERDKEKSK